MTLAFITSRAINPVRHGAPIVLKYQKGTLQKAQMLVVTILGQGDTQYAGLSQVKSGTQPARRIINRLSITADELDLYIRPSLDFDAL